MSLAFEHRKRTILKKLVTEEKIYVPDLAETLNVSSETIRRDLDRLEKEGKLKKVYGGAILANADRLEPPFAQKTIINQAEKRAIAKQAASLIEDGDIIMIGNGTTPLEIVRFLSDKKNITLITHSAPVLLLAIEVFKGKTIFIGGEVDIHQQSTHGPLAELTLKQIKANKAFISAGGVSIEDGITDYDLNEAYMSRLLMERSEELIVLADHTKLGETTFSHICELNRVSTVISDWNCPREWEEIFRDH
ncbi:DeoR/GlpR family DNA-binding transcription regulator, partial [Aneurinibacillus danicus]|uniref:DeoR/GlpR family DNA-binding transcription regulator n=1 Tax=Aneurinibacillus danicus TaxID=267746 RepID=UPI0011BE8BD9